jgi:hypothetical protein
LLGIVSVAAFFPPGWKPGSTSAKMADATFSNRLLEFGRRRHQGRDLNHSGRSEALSKIPPSKLFLNIFPGHLFLSLCNRGHGNFAVLTFDNLNSPAGTQPTK